MTALARTGSSVVGVAPRRAAAVSVIPPGPDWPPADPRLAEQFLAATNAFRAKHGVAPLAFLSTLEGSATWKVMHEAFLEYLAHDDPAPPLARSWSDRIADNGYTGAAGENLCYGTEYGPAGNVIGLTPQGALDILVSQGPGEGHYDNIVSPTWSVCGMAAAADPKSGQVFYAQDFGVAPPSGPQPVVTAIAPERGPIGTLVTVTGLHLTGATLVVFQQNLRAKFGVLSDTSVQATVPAGAVSGPVILATAGGVAVSSASFMVDDSPAPPPPPGPPPVLPVKDETWRLKGKPHAALLLILPSTTAQVVHFRNERTGMAGHQTMGAFLRTHERVTA